MYFIRGESLQTHVLSGPERVNRSEGTSSSEVKQWAVLCVCALSLRFEPAVCWGRAERLPEEISCSGAAAASIRSPSLMQSLTCMFIWSGGLWFMMIVIYAGDGWPRQEQQQAPPPPLPRSRPQPTAYIHHVAHNKNLFHMCGTKETYIKQSDRYVLALVRTRVSSEGWFPKRNSARVPEDVRTWASITRVLTPSNTNSHVLYNTSFWRSVSWAEHWSQPRWIKTSSKIIIRLSMPLIF